MYTLKFNDEIIGKYKGTDECWDKIKTLLEKWNFKSHYFWCSYLENSYTDIMVDYGSHTNFFYMIKDSDVNE